MSFAKSLVEKELNGESSEDTGPEAKAANTPQYPCSLPGHLPQSPLQLAVIMCLNLGPCTVNRPCPLVRHSTLFPSTLWTLRTPRIKRRPSYKIERTWVPQWLCPQWPLTCTRNKFLLYLLSFMGSFVWAGSIVVNNVIFKLFKLEVALMGQIVSIAT